MLPKTSCNHTQHDRRGRAPEPTTPRMTSLRRSFILIFSGGATYAVCQWLLVVIIAKLGTPEMLGTFALGLAIAAPVMLFCDMRLRVIHASDALDRYDFTEYLAVRIGTSLVGFAFITMLALALGYRREVLVVIVLIAAAKAVESISGILYGFLQKSDRPSAVGSSSSVKGLLSLLFVASALHFTGSLICAAAALFSAWLLILLTYDLANVVHVLRRAQRWNGYRHFILSVRKGASFHVARTIVMTALPMGLVASLSSLTVNIPRYAIEAYRDTTALGFFAALAYGAIIPGRIVFTLGEASIARLGITWVTSPPTFRSLVLKLSSLVGVLGILGIAGSALFGKPILSHVYRPEYAQHSSVLVLIMIYGAFSSMSSWLSYALTATRHLKSQALLAATAAIIALAISGPLVRASGLSGAAWTLIISSAIQAVGATALLLPQILSCERESQA